MKRVESIIDRRFGRLVVLSEAGRSLSNKLQYICQCDCGGKPTISRGCLISGYTKSCGCIQKERLLPGKNHFNYIDGRKSNKEYLKKQCANYYKENKKTIAKKKREWNKNNPDKVAEAAARKRARKRNQTPILTENEKRKISLYYQIAVYLGKEFHVDHIHPLSKKGLHHPDNLQILTAEVNMEKHNKWPLTEAEKIKYKGIRI